MGISLGLVGLGAFGKGFAELFRKHPAVGRVGLCDRETARMEVFASREAWKGKFDRKDMYDSLDDIIKADFDALVIITQPWLHAPQCIQAMESGKHVYSAVPIISLPDGDEILDWCDKLVKTCEKTGRHYMLGETTYYRPQTMYCRRRAAEGAFGEYVFSEAEYFHDFADPDCDLRKVQRHRLASKAGQEWAELSKTYKERGVQGGPMHYPTHSIGGPVCVMKAHAEKVCAWGYEPRSDDPYFEGTPFSNETALFFMSNGTTMRVCEYREIGHAGTEQFNLYGTAGSFKNGSWHDKESETPVTLEEMRDPLPDDVAAAWRDTSTDTIAYGGHGGSHAYLVHEFCDAIANDRTPAINVWESVRYMAPGVIAHKSAMAGGEVLAVPDWGDAPA